jgi:hypothetical protein
MAITWFENPNNKREIRKKILQKPRQQTELIAVAGSR